jgi:hypothetical protein
VLLAFPRVCDVTEKPRLNEMKRLPALDRIFLQASDAGATKAAAPARPQPAERIPEMEVRDLLRVGGEKRKPRPRFGRIAQSWNSRIPFQTEAKPDARDLPYRPRASLLRLDCHIAFIDKFISLFLLKEMSRWDLRRKPHSQSDL